MNEIARPVDTLHPAYAVAAAALPRLDVYTTIHKALRLWMADTLTRLGRLDATDADETTRTLDQLDALLQQLRSHLEHESDFIHTAIEARRPGGARQSADDHLLHLDAIANLEDESRALRSARDDRRGTLALRLYRHFAVFVGENLEHMQLEEGANNAALWNLYSDAELTEIHDRLLAAVGAAEMAQIVRWMAPALTPQELAAVFGDLQTKAPPEAMRVLLGTAREALDEARWAALARALGIVAVPGG